MAKKEYSTELTKMLSELEDPDIKRPSLRRFQNLDQEEREIYMTAAKKQPKADDTPSIDASSNDASTDDVSTDIDLASR